jgi:hypothetical protein
MSSYSPSTRNDYVQNFPFSTIREKQVHILNEICDAFNSDYKYSVLEAPPGFGKSPVAIAVAMTLGSSYICTSTKDLQTQYVKDFPFVKIAKGMNNFSCLVKDDFIRNDIYKCGLCIDLWPFSSCIIKRFLLIIGISLHHYRKKGLKYKRYYIYKLINHTSF